MKNTVYLENLALSNTICMTNLNLSEVTDADAICMTNLNLSQVTKATMVQSHYFSEQLEVCSCVRFFLSEIRAADLLTYVSASIAYYSCRIF